MKLFTKLTTISLLLLAGTTTVSAQECNKNILKQWTDDWPKFHQDGTVTDERTHLMWQRCSVGQSGGACQFGTPKTYTWETALKYVKDLNSNGGFAGHTDWRLPNIKELASIVDQRCWNPSINSSVFGNTPNGEFWTSTPYRYDTHRGNKVLTVQFGLGSDDSSLKTANNYIRLVRN